MHLIKKIFLKILKVFHFSGRPPPYYRLSSVDLNRKSALLQVIHKNIFIKQTFSQIISTPSIIDGLSCEHACWLGFYYGRMLEEARSKVSYIKNHSYLLKYKYGKYKIVCENRDGTLSCLHMKTHTEVNANPLSIAKDKKFITQFDSNQACFIGILAGIEMHKKKYSSEKKSKHVDTSYLRLVKYP